MTTVVRFGRAGVQSMVSDPGCADCVVSFETTEALRNLPNVREGGYLLVADESIQPLPVLIGRASMPEQARETLAAAGATLIPAGDIAVGDPPRLLARGMGARRRAPRASQDRRCQLGSVSRGPRVRSRGCGRGRGLRRERSTDQRILGKPPRALAPRARCVRGRACQRARLQRLRHGGLRHRALHRGCARQGARRAAGYGRGGHATYIALSVKDIARAEKLLAAQPVELIGQDDLARPVAPESR